MVFKRQSTLNPDWCCDFGGRKWGADSVKLWFYIPHLMVGGLLEKQTSFWWYCMHHGAGQDKWEKDLNVWTVGDSKSYVYKDALCLVTFFFLFRFIGRMYICIHFGYFQLGNSFFGEDPHRPACIKQHQSADVRKRYYFQKRLDQKYALISFMVYITDFAISISMCYLNPIITLLSVSWCANMASNWREKSWILYKKYKKLIK